MRLYLKRVMCYFGFHKWKYEGYHLDKSRLDTWRVNKRYCERCGKKQELFYDIYDGEYWANVL